MYKSTAHILNNPFEKLINFSKNSYYYHTPNIEWDYQKKISIHDIKMWQQLYYIQGIIGIYAAHDPMIEFYIITHNIFLDKKEGIETFYGIDCTNDLISRAKQFGITLFK